MWNFVTNIFDDSFFSVFVFIRFAIGDCTTPILSLNTSLAKYILFFVCDFHCSIPRSIPKLVRKNVDTLLQLRAVSAVSMGTFLSKSSSQFLSLRIDNGVNKLSDSQESLLS